MHNNEYKNKLLSFYGREKRMPTYSEMMDIFSFKSKNAVYRVVQKLIDANLISKDSSGRLSPNASLIETPVLGLVKAGFPSQSEQMIETTINLDDFLIEKKGSTYILEVDGDSMIDAHIADGDMVIAEQTNKAKDGDIVIAQVDGEFTMKYFRQTGTEIWLEPANKKYPPIYPQIDLRIAAIIKGVIRKY